MQIINCRQMDFHVALTLQDRLVQAIAAGQEPDTLLLLEHPPVYTMGRGGNDANLLDPGLMVIRTNRGGDVTWHGPGQLVAYPLVNLGNRGGDLHVWLRFLEELMLRTVCYFGVAARRIAGKTGIWTDHGKLASVGIGVRRQVTMHGVALNVNPDLAAFTSINPCGMPDCPVTSLARELPAAPELSEVKERTAILFRRLLDELVPVTSVPRA
jgi:lipoyl(octanoyl) transferase